MANRLQFRRGTSTQAAFDNPVLAAGELGFETDTRQFKVGDGVTDWNHLQYGGLVGQPGPPGDNYWQGSNRFISNDPPDPIEGYNGDFWFQY